MITTYARPLIIPTPRLAFFNALGEAGSDLVQEDSESLTPLFSQVLSVSERIRECDVLFAYVRIDGDGAVENTNESLERIVIGSGAPIVVIATENSGESYIRAASWFNTRTTLGRGSVNLVMTVARRGVLFSQFFARLFAQMNAGVTMPMAWHNLAPQIPGMEHQAPDTIFVCGAGHIAFAKRPSFWSRLLGKASA